MSKGLESLKDLITVIPIETYHFFGEGIEKAKSIIKKELKALEILKAFDFKFEDYTEELNGSVCVSQRRIILDNDEIDLLKEVLK